MVELATGDSLELEKRKRQLHSKRREAVKELLAAVDEKTSQQMLNVRDDSFFFAYSVVRGGKKSLLWDGY
jgi:hypothetical protein